MTHPLDQITLEAEPPDGYPFVTLTDEENEEAKKIAKKIDEDHKDHPGTVKLTPNQRLKGVQGEFAFAKYFNINTNRIYLKYELGDDGIDFIINDISIETKTRDAQVSYPEPDLGIPIREDLRSDIYVLVEKNDNYYSFIGWSTKEEVKEADIQTFRLKNRVIHRNDLRRF